MNDPRTAADHLIDAKIAALSALAYVEGVAYEDYSSTEMIRSAVERKFAVFADALARAWALDPALAGRVEDLANFRALRDSLHGRYDEIDDALVWSAVTEKLPGALAALNAILEDIRTQTWGPAVRAAARAGAAQAAAPAPAPALSRTP